MNTFPVPIKVHKLTALQVCHEQKLEVKAVLSNGVILTMPVDTIERERMFRKFVERARIVYSYRSEQWSNAEWIEAGYDLNELFRLTRRYGEFRGSIWSTKSYGTRADTHPQMYDSVLRGTLIRPGKK